MPALRLVAADALPAADLHQLFCDAFADYVAGAPQLPLAKWPTLLARQCADLEDGRVALQDGVPVAFALVTRRPEATRWRLAAMGAVPAARGAGAAPALLDDLAHRARAAGARELELECFAQNERALRRYRRHGFTEVAELFGFEGRTPALSPGGGGPSRVEVEACDREAGLAALAAAQAGVPNVPLQTTARGLAALGDTLRVWRRGGAYLAFDPEDRGKVTVHGVFDASPDGTGADALLAAVSARYPDRPIVAFPLHRDDLGTAALRRAGLTPMALHQVLMVAPLG